MEDYNFWKDFFDTYQSLPEWMKALWLIVPPLFLLGLIALVMRYRLASKRETKTSTDNPITPTHRDDFDHFDLYRQKRKISNKPTVPLLPQPDSERGE